MSACRRQIKTAVLALHAANIAASLAGVYSAWVIYRAVADKRKA